ncbi:MAG: hypothetical protein COS84_05775 [Armatimonadetes bacterium CG07_land_8_20_14_0_80_40_9]|nr:MAG: hypothetical protein COS84_05775 [Armatimonadetes bacterium CG07_land_8_20_14_0_80_40_9]
MPSCIYCKVSKSFSDSHIIPEAFGQGPILSDSVCKGCNNAINKEVERSIISELAPLRNLLKLEGKRKKAPAFTGVVKLKLSIIYTTTMFNNCKSAIWAGLYTSF